MKKLFPGHFKESKETLKKSWENSLFVFDANILLNLYRYSDQTKNEFLSLLKELDGRTWLPYRAAEEYLDNSLTVIDQQERSYTDTVKSINSLKSDLESARQHPFVNEQVLKKVKKSFLSLTEELEKNKSVHSKRIYDDDIKESISSIFKENIGTPYDKEKLKEIVEEGTERYKQKIPPAIKTPRNHEIAKFSKKYAKVMVT